ncbi:MAG: hypothetical protein AAF614_01680 [Chloroflexota bacterium]
MTDQKDAIFGSSGTCVARGNVVRDKKMAFLTVDLVKLKIAVKTRLTIYDTGRGGTGAPTPFPSGSPPFAPVSPFPGLLAPAMRTKGETTWSIPEPLQQRYSTSSRPYDLFTTGFCALRPPLLDAG